MRGVSGEVCWGVGRGEGSCGKRCGGRCREVCWEVRKDVWRGEGCGRVYGVSGKCVGMWVEEWGRCREVC